MQSRRVQCAGEGLWWARGVLDRIFGGVGLRRGRRDPDFLRVGDSLDFWRVEEIEPGHRLRLYAEMILPGKAWLEFTVSTENGKTKAFGYWEARFY